MKYYLLLAAFVFSLSCSSDNKVQHQVKDQQYESNFKPVINDILGTAYTTEYNSSKDFAICIEKGDNDNSKTFLVYDFEADSVIFKDKLINGEIRWTGEYDFAVYEHPGIVKKNDQSVKAKYSFNVIKKKKNN